MTDASWMTEARALGKMISDANLQMEEHQMFMNGYSSPMTLIHRRNEVWRIKA